MKKQKIYPEVHVGLDFLKRKDVINRVNQMGPQIINVEFTHSVLGQVTEIFTILPSGKLRLHAVYPKDYQDEADLETVKDYYNNYLLSGEQTYLDYYHPEIGWYLQSRNVTEFTMADPEVV